MNGDNTRGDLNYNIGNLMERRGKGKWMGEAERVCLPLGGDWETQKLHLM